MANITLKERYKTNPFINSQNIQTKSKVAITPLNDNTWINQVSGEVGGTALIKRKEVDDNKFVKVFTDNIGFFFGLSSAGNKAFAVLMWSLQQNKDTDLIDLSDWTREEFIQKSTKKELSKPTFYRGLSELEKEGIIAKSQRVGWYFINPHFVFNGDRIVFITEISRKKEPTLFDEENNAIAIE